MTMSQYSFERVCLLLPSIFVKFSRGKMPFMLYFLVLNYSHEKCKFNRSEAQAFEGNQQTNLNTIYYCDFCERSVQNLRKVAFNIDWPQKCVCQLYQTSLSLSLHLSLGSQTALISLPLFATKLRCLDAATGSNSFLSIPPQLGYN